MILNLILIISLICPPVAIATEYEPTYVTSWGFYGPGPGTFRQPMGILCYNNEIYVCDQDNARIQIFNENGTFLRQFGVYGSTEGFLNGPSHIALYNSSFYVTEYGNHRVSVFSTAGNFLSSFGTGRLSNPRGIFISVDKIYITNKGLNNVAVFDINGNFLFNFGQFNDPTGIAGANGRIYVADTRNNSIQIFDEDGVFAGSIPVSYPLGLKVLDGTLYCTKKDGVIRYTYDFQILAEWGCQGSAYKYYFNSPSDITFDGVNSIYIADTSNNEIDKWSYFGVGGVSSKKSTWGGIKSMLGQP